MHSTKCRLRYSSLDRDLSFREGVRACERSDELTQIGIIPKSAFEDKLNVLRKAGKSSNHVN